MKKRPAGLTAISILWALAGIGNIYVGQSGVSDDLGAYHLLSTATSGLNSTQIAVINWLQFGLPADTFISGLAAAMGLAQFIVVYGLWNGKPWSYWGALAIVILISVIWISHAVLYFTAPPILRLASPTLVSGSASSVLWVGIYLWYFRKPHVRDYLKVLPKAGQTG